MKHYLIRKRTDHKNRIHNIFDTELFHLSNVLTDVFGKSGRMIMDGILQGKSADEVIMSLKGQVRIKKRGRDSSASGTKPFSICPYATQAFFRSLKGILDVEINYLTKICSQFAQEHYPREYEILITVLGAGEIAAFTLLAKIGDF